MQGGLLVGARGLPLMLELHLPPTNAPLGQSSSLSSTLGVSFDWQIDVRVRHQATCACTVSLGQLFEPLLRRLCHQRSVCLFVSQIDVYATKLRARVLCHCCVQVSVRSTCPFLCTRGGCHPRACEASAAASPTSRAEVHMPPNTLTRFLPLWFQPLPPVTSRMLQGPGTALLADTRSSLWQPSGYARETKTSHVETKCPNKSQPNT